MGTISLEHIDNLFWLGRYTERVYTTLRLYFESYDAMIDLMGEDYKTFCDRIDIPDIYGSADVFKARYPFDTGDPNSIISNMTRLTTTALSCGKFSAVRHCPTYRWQFMTFRLRKKVSRR